MGQTSLASRVARVLSVLALASVASVSTHGCRKQTDAVESVPAARKPSAVKRKPREGEAAVNGPDSNAKPATAVVAGTAPAVAPAQTGSAGGASVPAPPAAADIIATGGPAPDAGGAPAPVAVAPAAAVAVAPTPVPPAEPAAIADPVPGTVPARAPVEVAVAALAPPAEAPAAAVPELVRPPDPEPAAPVVEPVPPGEPPLDVTGYIWAADLEQVLGSKQKFRRADLAGIAPSPRYNALYFAPQKGDLFGVGVQVWRDENLAESRTRFNTMRNTWSNVAPTNKVTEQGFRSYFGSVVSLVFADPRRPLIAAVTCSQKACNADALIALSQRVAERLR